VTNKSEAVVGYIHQQLHKNYVCEILLEGEVVSIVTIARSSCSIEAAKTLFRGEAKKIKDEEGVPSITMRVHS
jgi:hypothetical protein